MNLEKTMMEFHDKELISAMDRQLYLDLMFTTRLDEGWHHIQIPKFIDNKHAVDITHWLVKNVNDDEYQRDQRDFIFKNSRDATLFVLRWM